MTPREVIVMLDGMASVLALILSVIAGSNGHIRASILLGIYSLIYAVWENTSTKGNK